MYEVARGQVGCLLGRALRLAMHAMSHDGLILARRSKTVSQNLREVAEPATIYRFLVIKEAREAGIP